MSRRNTRAEKQLRRLRRSLRRGRLPARIDLIDYLKLHGHAQTTGEATRIIIAKRVRSESHVLGFTDLDGETIVDATAPAHVRDSIVVLDAA